LSPPRPAQEFAAERRHAVEHHDFYSHARRGQRFRGDQTGRAAADDGRDAGGGSWFVARHGHVRELEWSGA
jgi:hypothetical protein